MKDAFWQSTTWLLIGLIIGFVFSAVASSAVTQDEIRAGSFQKDGVAYKVEKVSP